MTDRGPNPAARAGADGSEVASGGPPTDLASPPGRDARAEQWVACNLCGADDYEVVFDAGKAQAHRIVRCKGCDLMYANPRFALPDFEGLGAFEPGDESWLEKDRYRLPKELRQVRDYRGTRADLVRMFPERGRLVEAGCGTGSLLAAFVEDGWEVEGVDPWAEACHYAESHYGIRAHVNTFTEMAYPDDSLDVILMIHVIEHMLDPAANFADVHRVLKPGGVLVMETPRYDSLAFRLLGRRERSVSCDEHIYFFTTQTLSRFAERAGLVTQKVACVGRTLSLARLAYQVGVVSKSPRLERAITYLGDKLRLQRLWIHLNARDMMRAYFVKPGGNRG